MNINELVELGKETLGKELGERTIHEYLRARREYQRTTTPPDIQNPEERMTYNLAMFKYATEKTIEWIEEQERKKIDPGYFVD